MTDLDAAENLPLVPAHKAARLATLRRGLAELRPVLTAAAGRLGGRFLLYGSAASGALRWNSDIDLLLDFPDDATTRAAWDLAEEACARLDLPHDIRPLHWCDAAFLRHILPHAEPLA